MRAAVGDGSFSSVLCTHRPASGEPDHCCIWIVLAWLRSSSSSSSMKESMYSCCTWVEERPTKIEHVRAVVEHDHGTPVLSFGFGGDEHRETFLGLVWV